MSATEESADTIRLRDNREFKERLFRPMLWEKLALGLTIPKEWAGLFDLKKEEADMNAMIEKGLL